MRFGLKALKRFGTFLRISGTIKHLLDRIHTLVITYCLIDSTLPTFLENTYDIKTRAIVVQHNITPAMLAKARSAQIGLMTDGAEDRRDLGHNKRTPLYPDNTILSDVYHEKH